MLAFPVSMHTHTHTFSPGKPRNIMAVGEVSENPASNAVTRPTVVETRDQDIDRKLRLYGISNAFSNGILISRISN